MPVPATITAAIVDAAYEDALRLAEEARMVFQQDGQRSPAQADDGAVSVALSCEGLRTTTRLMHALAWLLNYRAYFAGELSEQQLRRHGRLPPPQPLGDPAQTALLDRATLDLIERSCALYARVERLNHAWGEQLAPQPEAVHRLRQQLGQIFAAH